MIVKAMAPARVCDFGGWTDTWFAKHGRVMNIAVDLYAKVIISPITIFIKLGALALDVLEREQHKHHRLVIF